VGSTTTSGNFTLQAGSTGGMAIMDGDASGGARLTLSNSSGYAYATLAGSAGTTGSKFWLSKDAVGDNGFWVETNVGSSGSGRMDLIGASESFSVNLTQTGNSAVVLPSESVGSDEILDEPGVANIQASSETSMTTGSVKTVASRTIVAPSSGYVFAVGTAQLKVYNYDSGSDRFWFGISDQINAWSGAVQETYIELPGVLPGGWYYYQAMAQGLFPVSSGTHTFHLNVLEEYGEGWVSARQLTLMYFPTAHGSVDLDD
jgi:hypothetical protein